MPPPLPEHNEECNLHGLARRTKGCQGPAALALVHIADSAATTKKNGDTARWDAGVGGYLVSVQSHHQTLGVIVRSDVDHGNLHSCQHLRAQNEVRASAWRSRVRAHTHRIFMGRAEKGTLLALLTQQPLRSWGAVSSNQQHTTRMVDEEEGTHSCGC